MSRRSANLSRFAGTSQPADGGYGQPGVDDGTYPLRPLSRNRSSKALRNAAGPAGELSGGSNDESYLRATPQVHPQNGSGQRKLNSRRKSRLSDADQDDGYLSSGTGDGQEEQDHLLLANAGVEGAWPLEHPTFRPTGPGSSVCFSKLFTAAARIGTDSPCVTGYGIGYKSLTMEKSTRCQQQVTDDSLRTRRYVKEHHEAALTITDVDSIVKTNASMFPPNVIRNQKYSIISFLPLVFYEQFKFFFNLYFLLVALSQFIPALKIGEPSVAYIFFRLAAEVSGRFHRNVHRSSGICPQRYHGKRSI